MTPCQIDETIKDDLHGFEEFLKKLGFKRLEGSIYGVLVLVEENLSAEEIQNFLGLSQSAVSNALKTLVSFNAVVLKNDRDRGCRLYEANEDCLNIVANVFRKRELSIVRDYKLNIKRLKNKAIDNGENEESLRVRRFNSILTVGQLGEVILQFIFTLDEMDSKHRHHIQKITNKLPKVLDLMTQGPELAHDGVNLIKGMVGSRMKGYFGKITGESSEQ